MDTAEGGSSFGFVSKRESDLLRPDPRAATAAEEEAAEEDRNN